MIEMMTTDGLVKLVLFALAVAVLTWIVTRWAAAWLRRRALLDHPNERSSHSAPTPRGGGIAVLAIVLPLMGGIHYLYAPDAAVWAALGAAAALAALSWADDLGNLPVGLRLAAHVAAVTVVLALVPERFLLFQGALPLIADRIVAGLAWVWFLNLFNFMDGIDGIAGVETAAIGFGLFAILLLTADAGGPVAVAGALDGLVLAAAALGFLLINWHPARVFLGDVGSIPLGFLLGWLLVTLAMWGYWAEALILPAYYLADATLTITRRALRGTPVWQAHKEHFYQQAVARGFGHGRVARFIAAGNTVLVLIAILAAYSVGGLSKILCLAAAAAVVTVMLGWLARAMPPGPQDKRP